MVDQMNLIATNANTLAPQCAGYTPTGTTGANGTAPINGGPLLNAYTGSGVTYGQLVKYVAPAANQVACFSATFNSQDVDTVRQFFWTTTPQITGGNITSWVSATFNGADIGGTLKNQIFGGPSGNFTNLTNFTVPSATTYYWCLKIDKDGNNIGVQLWPGNPPSGGA